MRRVWWIPLVVASLAHAQLEARFSLPKTRYMSGEPIFLVYTVKNTSDRPLQILQAEPNSFCSGFQVEVERTDVAASKPCAMGFGGSCLSGATELKPGESRSDRYLLNYDHDLKKPGHYAVVAKRNLTYSETGPGASFFTPGHPAVSASSQFDVEVVEADPQAVAAILAPYFADFKSSDFQRSTPARRVIEKLASPAVESQVLALADDPHADWTAISALREANTAATRKKLAEIASSNAPNHSAAVSALGDTGDSSYWPLLRDLADRQDDIWTILTSAAKLGREEAVPWLIAKLRSPDAKTRGAALWALRATGSRKAIAPLIDMIGDSDRDIQTSAQSALVQMTNHTYDPRQIVPEDAAAAHAAWIRWWAQHHETAHISGPNDPYCGHAESLN